MPHSCPTKFSWPFKIEYCLFGNLDSTQELSCLNCYFWISYGIKFSFSLTILPLYWMKIFCFTLTTFQAPSQNCEKRQLDSLRLSDRLFTGNNSVPIGWLYMKLVFEYFSKIPENRAVYEIMWKSMAQPDRPQITIKYVYGACAFSAG